MLPMAETATYTRLLRAAGGSQRARRWADATFADLLLIAGTDRPDLPIAHSTLRQRRLDLRRAGVAPIADAGALAVLATDLGRTDPDALARLVWVLNADRQGTRERVALRYADLARRSRARLSGRRVMAVRLNARLANLRPVLVGRVERSRWLRPLVLVVLRELIVAVALRLVVGADPGLAVADRLAGLRAAATRLTLAALPSVAALAKWTAVAVAGAWVLWQVAASERAPSGRASAPAATTVGDRRGLGARAVVGMGRVFAQTAFRLVAVAGVLALALVAWIC